VEHQSVWLVVRLAQDEIHILVPVLADIDHFHELRLVGQLVQGEMMIDSFQISGSILGQKYHCQGIYRLMEVPKRFLMRIVELLEHPKNGICRWKMNYSAMIVARLWRLEYFG
jgi:hypothetical protein